MAEARSVSQLIAALQDEPRWQRLCKIRRPLSFLSVLQCDAWEDGHTYFLTWLLDPNPGQSSHGLGELPLRRFLALVGGAIRDLPNGARARAEEPVRWLAELLTRDNPDYTFVNAPKLTSQHSKHADSRPDLFIEFSIEAEDQSVQHVRLILENKVCAGESNRQTETYWANYSKDWLEKDHHLLGVYLTPISSYDLKSLGEPACICKQFVQINYQMLLDQVLERCLGELKKMKGPEPAMLLEQYIRTLGYSKVRANASVMALREGEREELSQLWNTNEVFFQQLSEAYPDRPNEDHKQMQKFRKKHEDAFVELSASLAVSLPEEQRKKAIRLRNLLGEVPLVQRVRKWWEEANLGADWQPGGRDRCLQLNFTPFSNFSGEEHRDTRGVLLETPSTLRFFLGAEPGRRPCLDFQFVSNADGGWKPSMDWCVAPLRHLLGAEVQRLGGRVMAEDSLYLFKWTFDNTTTPVDAQADVCKNAITKLVPIVHDWFATLLKQCGDGR